MKRYVGLDALRGFAALVVVVHHVSVVFPQFAGGADVVPPPGPWPRSPWPGDPWAVVLQSTPVNALFAGPQAVFLFFILSGFVLALPFDRTTPVDWRGYYPKRILRLYVPIIAAVLLALVTIALVPRTTSPDHTWWLNSHVHPVTVPGVFKEMLLLPGAGRYDTPLWSLKWEVAFSLLLPAYIVVGHKLKRWWYVGVPVLVAASALGAQVGWNALKFLPMFGIGVLMAFGRESITTWIERSPRTRGAWSCLAGSVLLASTWAFPDMGPGLAVTLLGCSLVLVAFMTWQPLLELSDARSSTWLASRSFSLYLVHEPIVVSLALVSASPVVAAALSAVLVPVVTEAFFRVVERPSRRLAGAAGRALSKRSMEGRRSTVRIEQ